MNAVEQVTYTEISSDQQPLAEEANELCEGTFGNDLKWEGNYRVYVATEGDRVVGVANVSINEGHSANIRFIATNPERRSRGVGSIMLEGVLSEAEEAGCTVASLTPTAESDATLDRFYERHGFTYPNRDSLSMRKTLQPRKK